MADTSPPIFTYSINTTWDSQNIDHSPIIVSLIGKNDSLEVFVRGPFFNDPEGPDDGTEGGAYWQLWNYEVAEVFFLGDNDRYLEVELCPRGQQLVLLLNGQQNDVADCLPLNFAASTSCGAWQGTATIPKSYFPPNVNRFNAYAIHGSGENRIYESLYPCPQGEYENPDFHRLEYFQPIDFGTLIPDNPASGLSQLWQDAIDGRLKNFTCYGK